MAHQQQNHSHVSKEGVNADPVKGRRACLDGDTELLDHGAKQLEIGQLKLAHENLLAQLDHKKHVLGAWTQHIRVAVSAENRLLVLRPGIRLHDLEKTILFIYLFYFLFF
jgi:hypothetical protein